MTEIVFPYFILALLGTFLIGLYVGRMLYLKRLILNEIFMIVYTIVIGILSIALWWINK